MHENVCTASDRINPSKIVFFFFLQAEKKSHLFSQIDAELLVRPR